MSEKAPNQLYRERSYTETTNGIEALNKIVSGEVPSWELSSKEKSEILKTEVLLADTLQEIYSITTPDVTFDLAYLRTPEGQQDFATVTRLDIPTAAADPAAWREFLYQRASDLNEVDQKELEALAGRAKKYRRDEIFNALAATMDENGSIDVGHIPTGFSVALLPDPAEDARKAHELREFKHRLKTLRETVNEDGGSADKRAVFTGVLDLYQKRTNELLALQAEKLARIHQKAKSLGEGSLTELELRVREESRVPEDHLESGLSRYDKFLYGASPAYDDEGYRRQVSDELAAFAEAEEKAYIEKVETKTSGIEDMGLDPEKLSQKNIDIATIVRYCEETLEHYGLLSKEPPETYDPQRPGPAADGGWQVVVSDAYGGLAANYKQRIIKCPNKKQSIDKLLSVTIAHEIEGHVLQHANQSKIPLRLYESGVRGDRKTIFEESGGMQNQNYVTQQAFGYGSPSLPQYIRAMVAKLNGGTYADCVRAYYDSTTQVYQKQLATGLIDEKTFRKECRTRLRVAVASTRRLFYGDYNSTDDSRHLVRSRDTAYLEQLELATELKKAGMEKFLYVLGANFSSLEFLLRARFLDPNDIRLPDFYSLELWGQVRDAYVLGDED